VLTLAFVDLPAKDVARYRESSGSLRSHDLDALAVMGARNLVCRRDDLREEHRPCQSSQGSWRRDLLASDMHEHGAAEIG
jgi:protein tyrosine phosphatase (PTP) superfamily phosphohydrolase (DUF442 family)